MAEQYIYAVARIRSRELGLLSESFIDQLLQAEDEAQCRRLLAEKGWASPETDSEAMLSAEKEKTWDLIRELVPDDIDKFDVFLLSADYHNLKAAVKESCIAGEHPGIFVGDGTVPASKLLEAAESSDFSEIPGEMREVAARAKELLLTTQDGQLCDCVIDRAALMRIREAGKASGEQLLADYGELICATGDIKIAVRAAQTGKNRQFLEEALAPCDTLDLEELTAAALTGPDAVCAYLDRTRYAEAAQELKKSTASFERWCDNALIRSVKPQIHNPFGIGPLAAYILARENEIKTVRIILAAKRNQLSEEAIRERVREMYV